MIIPRTYGRMGNYLFQVASTIGYARKHGISFTVPTTTKDATHNPIYLQHLANSSWNPRLPEVRVLENGHGYQEIPFKPSWANRNIVLDGYWQTEKYFSSIRQTILDLFHYPWRPEPGIVSVHVRRGDYLRLTKKHPPVPKEWYEACMKRFPGRRFKFFSDDIAWCRAEFGNRTDCSFSNNTREEADLIDMSCCEHHISSASTFSWWGAWLNQNPNKQVLIPQRWFSELEERKLNTGDIVPPTWERV